MPFHLALTIEYESDTSWRWILSDAEGRFIADQEVRLDAAEPLYEGFEDLPRTLVHYEGVRPAGEVLEEVGAWMGEKVFGAVGDRLLEYERRPACVVQVRVPRAAQNLLFRPFELAHIGGRPLAERGFRLIYTVAHEAARRPGSAAPKDVDAGEPLRMLGVFSLPRDAAPLNLRQERFRLQKLVRRFVQTGGRAVELRLLQYGATRQLLEDVLCESPGWDVIHFSSHGAEGELFLEKADGTADRVAAVELAELLRPAAARLKLLTLSACYSGAADLRAARAQIGLDNPPAPAGAVVPHEATNVLPSLGQRLAEELDCAVLAMRYPVSDDFATELALTLYDRLLEKRQPLPQALQLALDEALAPERAPSLADFSRLAPLLFGSRAADLRLLAPPRTSSFEPPPTGLFGFPPVPERFVGRLIPMLDASRALAPESGQTGVLFYGIAGAGKTACALELAHLYDVKNVERFMAFVWHKAPEEGHDIADSLTRFALSMENQLPGLELVGLIDNPEDFRRKALPRLRGLLENHAILVVIDGLEGLLTPQGEWRDARWAELLNALLGHDGLSRLVLTSRRLPATLAGHARLRTDAIHALSFPESVLLARQLPNLKKLFEDESGRGKLRRILGAAQGHPKLLELADGLTADPAALEAQLARDEATTANADATRIAFFDTGHSDRPEDIFLRELRTWTQGVAQTLAPTAQLLAQFLARLEEADRTSDVIDVTWPSFLKRIVGERTTEGEPVHDAASSQAKVALGEPDSGLRAALGQLAQVGLIEIEETKRERRIELTRENVDSLLPILAAQNPALASQLSIPLGFNADALLPDIQAALVDPTDPTLQAWVSDQRSAVRDQQFRLHPGISEALVRSAPPSVLNAVDKELSIYFVGVFQHGVKTEMRGGGLLLIEGARRAVPYLLRDKRWDIAAALLEKLLDRDTRPDTLALAIPLLRHIAENTRDTETELENAGVLANALIAAGRYAEAEKILRDVPARAAERGNYHLVVAASGALCNLLIFTGRLEEALRTAEEETAYIRRADLGPWSLLNAEVHRLQALHALGRYEEVLAAVERHRAQVKNLPEDGSRLENVDPWRVLESLVEVGQSAAVELEQWEAALALNSERVEGMQRRGAVESDIAWARFAAYTPLLSLRRYKEARSLLEHCRVIFEQENAVHKLGSLYSAFARLESIEDHAAAAVRLQQTALRYMYLAGRPDDCATGHRRHAQYLERVEGVAAEAVLAHRLAAAILYLQTASGLLPAAVKSLAGTPLPPSPPSFARVSDIVEQVEGVRFRELFERLPRRVPDGEVAVLAVWEMVQAEASEKAESAHPMESFITFFEKAGYDVRVEGQYDLRVTPSRPAEKSSYGTSLVRYLEAAPTIEAIQEFGRAALNTPGAPAAGYKPAFLICSQLEPVHILQASVYQDMRLAVVPLTTKWVSEANESGEQRESLRNVLDAFVGRDNPFSNSNPVSVPGDFYGRKEVAADVIRDLDQGQSLGLFGMRKIGKTSLIQHSLRTRTGPTIYIDCQGLKRASAILRDLPRQLRLTLRKFLPNVRWPEFDQTGVTDLPALTDAVGRDLRELYEIYAARSVSVGKITLILDEVDRIVPDANSPAADMEEYEALFGLIRNLSQGIERIMVCMVAGYSANITLKDVGLGRGVAGNPVYAFFTVHRLGPMSGDEVAAMMNGLGSRALLQFTEEGSQRLYAWSGGHPFLSRLIGSVICRNLGDYKLRRIKIKGCEIYEVDAPSIDLAALNLLDGVSSRPFVKQILERFSDPLYKEIFTTLGGAGPEGCTRETLMAAHGDDAGMRGAVTDALDNLEMVSLVKNEGGRFRLFARLLVELIRRGYV